MNGTVPINPFKIMQLQKNKVEWYKHRLLQSGY